MAGVSAQETSELPPTVVTPTRTTQSIDDALPATSVITRADIDRWQSVDLVSILSRETGVQFAQAGGRGAAASLFLRGASSSQVLVLVDGVRLNAGTSGGAALGGIALDAIDRIEIVRGNLSSVYGSSAIGGVVQIFTRRGAKAGVTLSAEAGQGRTLRRPCQRRHRRRPGAAGRRDRRRNEPGVFVHRCDARRSEPLRAGRQSGSRRQRLSVRLAGRDLPVRGGTLLTANGWINRNTTDFDSTADGPVATHLEKSQLGAVNARHARRSPTLGDAAGGRRQP